MIRTKFFQTLFLSLCLTVVSFEISAQSANTKSEQKIKYKKARALQSSTAKKMAKVYEALERINEETGKEDPDYETAKEILGELRDNAENLKSYDRSVVWNSWGYLYIVDEEVQLAINSYNKLINEPEVTLGLRNAGLLYLAQLYMSEGSHQKAVDLILEWMSQVEKITAQSWSILAGAYYQLDDYEKALLNMEKAITLAEEEGYKPKENWYMTVVASVEELKDKIGPKKAMLKQVAIYEILVNLYPKKAYFVRLGQTYGQLDREKDFMVTLNSAYLKDLLDKETEYVTLAQLLLLNQNPYQAAKVLEAGRAKKVLKINEETKEEILVVVVKDNEKNLRLLADSWRMSQEIETAIPILEKAAKMSKDGKNYVLLGNLYLAEDNLELAIDSIKKGLDKGKVSKVSQVYLTLGQAYFELQMFNEAKKQFGKAARDKDKQVIATANNWIRYTEREEERVKNLELRREFIKNS
jgi:tetratricopeptide (TPR) repeat protein